MPVSVGGARSFNNQAHKNMYNMFMLLATRIFYEMPDHLGQIMYSLNDFMICLGLMMMR